LIGLFSLPLTVEQLGMDLLQDRRSH